MYVNNGRPKLFGWFEALPKPSDRAGAERRCKQAYASPGDDDLRRMYEIIQADARLNGRVEGLGFGRNGDAYRRAAAKLRVMELIDLLRDGKTIRNRIVHRPGYVPSEQDAKRALKQYSKADERLTQAIGG